MKSRIENCIQESIKVKQEIFSSEDILHCIELIVSKSVIAFNNDKKMLLCGNGGSAADAQHIAAELSGRFYKDRPALFAEALHVNTSYLTSVANDYGYEHIYSRMIEASGKKGDILIGISTSGNSRNVINAIITANKIDMVTIGFSGENGGEMTDLCDIMIKVPSADTARIQESHILIGHIMCQLIEQELFS